MAPGAGSLESRHIRKRCARAMSMKICDFVGYLTAVGQGALLDRSRQPPDAAEAPPALWTGAHRQTRFPSLQIPVRPFFRPANMAHLDKESSISGMFKAADYYYPLLSSRD